jgi:hypothetical protein
MPEYHLLLSAAEIGQMSLTFSFPNLYNYIGVIDILPIIKALQPEFSGNYVNIKMSVNSTNKLILRDHKNKGLISATETVMSTKKVPSFTDSGSSCGEFFMDIPAS